MKPFLDINQFPVELIPEARRVQCKQIIGTATNSAGMDAAQLNTLLTTLRAETILGQDGGIDEKQLLDTPNWAQPTANIGVAGRTIEAAGFAMKHLTIYHEYDFTGAAPQLITVLSKYNLDRAYELTGRKHKLLPIVRMFTGEAKDRIKVALAQTNVAGAYWELTADPSLMRRQRIVDGLKYSYATGKEVWAILTARNPSTTYADDVKESAEWLRARLPLNLWAKLYLGVAFYEKEKGVQWLGGNNSVEEALKNLKLLAAQNEVLT